MTIIFFCRSQRDPLAADPDAPQRVLFEVDKGEAANLRREEQRKFGVYFDDNYDYLQHLRDKGEDEVHWEEVDRFVLPKSQNDQQPRPSTSTGESKQVKITFHSE